MQASEINTSSLNREVAKLKTDGWRFVTMSAVNAEGKNIDLLYHFDKDIEMKHLRLTVKNGDNVPSISNVFFASFLVENEIQDQFGLKFDGLALDYGGTLYTEDDENVIRTPYCKYDIVDNSK